MTLATGKKFSRFGEHWLRLLATAVRGEPLGELEEGERDLEGHPDLPEPLQRRPESGLRRGVLPMQPGRPRPKPRGMGTQEWREL